MVSGVGGEEDVRPTVAMPGSWRDEKVSKAVKEVRRRGSFMAASPYRDDGDANTEGENAGAVDGNGEEEESVENADARQWDEKDVVKWLDSVGLRRDIVEKFKHKKVDGKRLLEITSLTLSDMGIKRQPTQRSILAIIEDL
ncbi:hypothetical protein BC829DRAFT_388632, partial [Chytridium lagenaria]